MSIPQNSPASEDRHPVVSPTAIHPVRVMGRERLHLGVRVVAILCMSASIALATISIHHRVGVLLTGSCGIMAEHGTLSLGWADGELQRLHWRVIAREADIGIKRINTSGYEWSRFRVNDLGMVGLAFPIWLVTIAAVAVFATSWLCSRRRCPSHLQGSQHAGL